jgi:hypothetical protein
MRDSTDASMMRSVAFQQSAAAAVNFVLIQFLT